MYKKIIAVAVCLVCVVGMCCVASADTYVYKPVLQYGVEYKITSGLAVWLQSFSSDDLYPFYFGDDFYPGVSSFVVGISPLTSSDYIITFPSGARVTFKYRIYSTNFEFLTVTGISNWFDFVNKTGSSGSTVHSYKFVSYRDPVATKDGISYCDFEVTIDNESADMLYFTGFRVGVTSYVSDWTFTGSIGCSDLRYHIWTESEKASAAQVDAINDQTKTITEGWVQGEVTPPVGSETIDDYSQQESALLDSQQSGLEAADKSFSDTLNSLLQYQAAFLGVASMIGNFVTASGAMQFLIYTSMSLGLCGFVIGLGVYLSRSARERENAKTNKRRRGG